MTIDYTPTELMATVASRLLENGKSVFVGTGLPIIAATLAQRTHAPNLLIVFEAGGIGPHVPILPISVGDSRTFHQAIAATSMHDVMSSAQAGYTDFGFLGAAMIDAHGNINTTVIGDHAHPSSRLPGSGGANDVGSFAWRTIIIMRQEKRRFMKKIDFVTTPGYLTGPGTREAAGLPAGAGPWRVITQLGVYGFHETSKQLQLIALHPGVTVEQVQENSEFEILLADQIGTTEPPTQLQRLILHEIDPLGIAIGK
ncbi:MAG TPA: CoA-transferase [Anaerolineae bacterium]|nr:CoA-transferase [Anaerolineae bacterium]